MERARRPTELQYFGGKQACLDAVSSQPHSDFLEEEQQRARARCEAVTGTILGRNTETVWNATTLTKDLLDVINYVFHTQGGRANDKL
jgi:hypothetical protein